MEKTHNCLNQSTQHLKRSITIILSKDNNTLGGVNWQWHFFLHEISSHEWIFCKEFEFCAMFPKSTSLSSQRQGFVITEFLNHKALTLWRWYMYIPRNSIHLHCKNAAVVINQRPVSFMLQMVVSRNIFRFFNNNDNNFFILSPPMRERKT